METTHRPEHDLQAVLVDIEHAFQTAGLKARVMRPPGDPFLGVVGYLALGGGKRRQVIATLEDDGHCRGRLSRAYRGEDGDDVVEPGEAEEFHAWPAAVGVGDTIATSVVDHATLAQAGDPDASLEEIRRALEWIADPIRDKGIFGNPRGPHLASLANAMIRLIERVERLERGAGGSR